MRLWSILTLLVFLNFTALPGVATLLGWKIPTTNIVLNEEESHTSVVVIYEKTLPKVVNVHDFFKFFQSDIESGNFILKNDSIHLSPYLTIFSPPPEA